jgi:hypothetical protein
MPGRSAADIVGRDQQLGRLDELVGRALDGERVTILVSGEAGIGKTTLVRAVTARAVERGARSCWGAGVDLDGAPGHWPWTQALTGLVRTIGVDRARELAGDDAQLLAAVVPAFGAPAAGEATDRDRLLLLDAIARFLDAVAAERPLVIVLDDLQWADESSLALLDFVARSPHRSAVCLLGAYRSDELNPSADARISALISHGHHLRLQGIDADAVHTFVERLLGHPVERSTAQQIHGRTGGHPFFVREIVLLTNGPADGSALQLPAAVRDVIERRIGRLPEPTQAVLEVAAVIGSELLPDVVANVLDISTVAVVAAAQDAVEAGVLTRTGDRLGFAHDLLRETVLDRLPTPRRSALHLAIGAALEDRVARTGQVATAQLARHFVAAVAVDGPPRAVRWALLAAAAECDAMAFEEAAAHLRRLRAAIADAGVDLEDDQLVDILVAEADALARAGHILDARGLLRTARDVVDRAGDPARSTRVALATARLGARFSARRDEIIRELEHALAVVAGTGSADEGQLTAALARELAHSVTTDRPRAGPLSEHALELGRQAGDPATLAACLLARHDVLWTPGTGGERAEIAREIVADAVAAGDDERHAEGLLLLANAQLEQGSPAFEAALDECLAILDRLGQPRHRYLAETRRACVALLRGRLDEAADRITQAAALGDRIREPDAGNVQMSQRLELVRARGNTDELAAFAVEAVGHWTGAPIHAHAVAAGFSARAGDLDAARQHIAAVVDLGTWRADLSYLWSVFVRELAQAAIAIGDRQLCRQLLDDLQPVGESCGVNGAVVAFAGSHAHAAGLLAAALDQPDLSGRLLDQASDTYRRLGAAGWLAELRHDLAMIRSAPTPAGGRGSMQRQGPIWHIAFNNRSGTVPHSKGLADIARLLASPGVEVHALDLIDGADRSRAPGPVADRQALHAYRRRLATIDREAAEAADHHDAERVARLTAERHALLDELRHVTTVHGRPRKFANHPAERARKAVTARVRDAIRKIQPILPELAAHLERNVITGTYCRYRADPGTTWDVNIDRTSRH